MTVAESRIPVIVGVGQINDRPEVPHEGLDSLGLMVEALRRADKDAGGGWLPGLSTVLTVDQISFPKLGDCSPQVAEAIGAAKAVCRQTPYPMGDGPIRLLNEAANLIATGEATSVAVTGGEALRTAGARRKLEAPNKRPDPMRESTIARKARYSDLFHLTTPIDVYPLYENACRAKWGQSLEEAQAESGLIWSIFSEVAAETEGAWIHSPKTPEAITTPSADNRPISFPYTKLMVANSSVNQGAAFIVTSLEAALARGIAEDRLIYVGLGAHAEEPGNILARDTYSDSVSMSETLEKALEFNGLTPGDLDSAELYSCFPCVPKLARRVIGWPVDRPMTVFGGLTFGGGPIANYMSHAVVEMVHDLREQGRYGLLFANGGYATYNHTIVVGRDRALAERYPQDFDVQAGAETRRGPVPNFVEGYQGEGEIETYTVHYKRDGSVRFGVVMGRSTDGETRFLAKIPASDTAGIELLTSGAVEPVGTAGRAVAGEEAGEGVMYWARD